MGSTRSSAMGITLALCVANASADSGITNHFSGFATIGLTSNSNDELIFRRDVTQKDGSRDGNLDWKSDSLLGLQWQTQWSYQLETTAQLVIKDRVENDLGNSLEWAFLRYRPLESLDLRIGRMGSDIFMLSDYRQVSYALPWVRPPHDTYGLFSFHHFDGVDVLKRISFGESNLNIKGFYGRLNQKYPLERYADSVYRLAFEGGGGSVSWERNEWKARYSYADVKVDNNNVKPLSDALASVAPLWPEADALSQSLITRAKSLRFHQLGLIYDNNTWWTQAELSHLISEADVISGTRHFYISAGRRIDAFTLYAVKGFLHSSSEIRHLSPPAGYPEPINQQLQALASVTENTFNGGRSDQESATLGVRWDFASRKAVKLQIEHFDIDKYGSALWLKTHQQAAPKDETANVISLSMDVLF
jgi:hypothetical protein